MTIRGMGLAAIDLARTGDGALMTALRETVAEARRRPGLKAVLRHYLAAETDELQMEMIAASPLEPDEIVALCERNPVAAKCDAAEANTSRMAGAILAAPSDSRSASRPEGALPALGGRLPPGQSPSATQKESTAGETFTRAMANIERLAAEAQRDAPLPAGGCPLARRGERLK